MTPIRSVSDKPFVTLKNKSARLICTAVVTTWLALSGLECLNAIRGSEALYSFDLSCGQEFIDACRDCTVSAKTIYGSEIVLHQPHPGVWNLSQVNDSGRRAVLNFRIVNAAATMSRGVTPAFRLRLSDASHSIDLPLEARPTGSDMLLEARPGDRQFSMKSAFRKCITYRGDIAIALGALIEGWQQALVLGTVLITVWSGWKFSTILNC
jgi:hypothetical protein